MSNVVSIFGEFQNPNAKEHEKTVSDLLLDSFRWLFTAFDCRVRISTLNGHPDCLRKDPLIPFELDLETDMTLETHDFCPCGSGKKIKFCCGNDITKELDKLTGRKRESIVQKRQKKTREFEIDSIEKTIDPSSESLDNKNQVPDIDKPKHGLGFLGYIFLLIIIGFSIVGILKTFENDLLSYFPETEYIYQLLEEQLEFFAETVKNMIVIVNDLISSY